MANTPKYLALISAISLSFFAAACGSDDGGSGDGATGADTAATTENNTGNNANEALNGGDGGDADANGDSGAGSDENLPGAEALDDMTEVDAADYTGEGSGVNAGAHFASTDGSIVCGITSAMAACHIGGNTIDWDDADRAEDTDDDAETGDPDFSDMIGWNPGVGAEFDAKPKTWLLQGQYAPDTVELDDGTKLTVVTSTDGSTLDITCGTKDNRMTCVSGDHGFTVGVAAYRVW